MGFQINTGLKLFTAIAFCSAFTANAQLVQLNLSFKKDTIFIGERTDLRVEIVKDNKVILKPFAIIDSLNKEIEIIDSLKTTGPDSFSFRITSFTPGMYIIPPVPLVFSFESTVDTIFSPPVLLTVLSPAINNQEDIKDIKPPLNLPFKLTEILPETGITLGILIILFIIVLYLIRRYRKKKQLEITEKELPPHVIAMRDLDRLKEQKLWQDGKIKEYHSRLSDIVRCYIERRFEIPAMENVSSETLTAFREKIPQEEMLFEMLEGILLTSDMVKFAKAEPLPAENQGNLDNAYLFIGQTKIEEVTTVGEKIEEREQLSDNDKTTKE